MRWSSVVVVALLALSGCGRSGGADGGGGGEGGGTGGGAAGGTGGGSGADAGVCGACVTSADCGAGAACVQVSGTDACLNRCNPGACGSTETCQALVANDGTHVQVCVPANGCGGTQCPATCPTGTSCDPVAGECVTTDAGVCTRFDGPDAGSCCTACAPTDPTCQINGCYGGWLCERAGCRCRPPTTPCPTGIDGGGVEDAGITGTVTLDGGTVSRLYFAVVGDTRPALPDDTAHYPTEIITQIFDAMEAMSPRPQFVVGTGDYVFASPLGSQGGPQLDLYLSARSHFSNPFFPSMGNHECTSATTVNCTGLSAGSTILAAYMAKFMQPMGKSVTYYSFDVNGPGNVWTAKFVVASCNVWDATQKAWVQAQLARPTTYTFMVRHIPMGVNSPCTSELDPIVRAANPTMILVGHTHTFSHSGNQLIEGVGGAPISGNATYGYATIEQLTSGVLRVTQWDSATRQPVATYTVP